MKDIRFRILALTVACLILICGCTAGPSGEGQSGPGGATEAHSAPGSTASPEVTTAAETAAAAEVTTAVGLTTAAGITTSAELTTSVDVTAAAELTTASPEVTTAPVTTAPVTTTPVTTVPVTTTPVTTVPVTTVPVTTAPVTTVPVTTAEVTTSPEVTTVPEVTTAPEVTTSPEVTSGPSDPPDTRAPFFLNLSRSVTLKKGSAFDIHKYISYVDDLDPDVILDVTGSVDPGTVGVYELKFRISDHSGNSTSSSMKVEIVEKIQSGSSGSSTALPTKSFQTFIDTYKTEKTMVGIDVSRYQGKIDFDKVAAAGCEFVIIKFGGFAGGETFTDACYVENLKNAKAAGLKIGIYWYSSEGGAAAVRENAKYLYDSLNGEHLDFPIFFDWENYINFENYKMSLRDYNDMVLAFKDEARAHGYRGALYGSKSKLLTLFTDEVKEGGVWLAHYTDQTTYTGDYFLWQQGLARIDGINGDVDVDVFYPDRLTVDW